MTSAIIQVLGGGIFGVLVAYITMRVQRKYKHLEYYYTSMPLLRFRPASQRLLTVNVNKAALTGNAADKDTTEAIESAYGFSIRLRNAGNEIIEAPTVDVTLDGEAKIIEFSTKPVATPDFNLEARVNSTALNRLSTKIPYINPDEIVHIALISTGNKNPNSCEIIARGKGLQAYPHGRFRSFLPILIGLAMVFGSVGLIQSQRLFKWLPENIVTWLGGHMETRMIWPTPLKGLIVAIAFSLLMLLFYRLIRKFEPPMHTPWGSD